MHVPLISGLRGLRILERICERTSNTVRMESIQIRGCNSHDCISLCSLMLGLLSLMRIVIGFNSWRFALRLRALPLDLTVVVGRTFFLCTVVVSLSQSWLALNLILGLSTRCHRHQIELDILTSKVGHFLFVYLI